MPLFAVWSGRLPGFSVDEAGLLQARGGEPVFVQMVVARDDEMQVRLETELPDAKRIADFLNDHASRDFSNGLVAMQRVASELERNLEGRWTFPEESANGIGPTRCFTALMGFLHEAFDARASGRIRAQGTVEQWSRALSETLPEFINAEGRVSPQRIVRAVSELDALLM